MFILLQRAALSRTVTFAPRALATATSASASLIGSNIVSVPRRTFAATAPSQGDVVGIDLGTNTSCVAMMDGKALRIIENSEGVRTTPSVVAFTSDGTVLVGTPARRQQVQNLANTFDFTKRILGRKFTDPVVQAELSRVGYKIVEGAGGDAWVEVNGKKTPVSHISGHILAKMRLTAEETLGRKVDQAVITIPAHFSDAQRNATKEAAKMAGYVTSTTFSCDHSLQGCLYLHYIFLFTSHTFVDSTHTCIAFPILLLSFFLI